MSHAISAPPIDPVILAHRQAAGTDLLRAYLALLLGDSSVAGFARYRVDEIRRPHDGLRVRYGFTGGEWRIQVARPDEQPFTVKYDCRHPLPTTGQLLQATLDGPPPGWAPDANGEMVIRGITEETEENTNNG